MHQNLLKTSVKMAQMDQLHQFVKQMRPELNIELIVREIHWAKMQRDTLMFGLPVFNLIPSVPTNW